MPCDRNAGVDPAALCLLVAVAAGRCCSLFVGERNGGTRESSRRGERQIFRVIGIMVLISLLVGGGKESAVWEEGQEREGKGGNGGDRRTRSRGEKQMIFVIGVTVLISPLVRGGREESAVRREEQGRRGEEMKG